MTFHPVLPRSWAPRGHLDVSDLAPSQVENCRRKLRAFANASVSLWDAAEPRRGVYDVVCCFFLLHEVPERYKHRVAAALLESVHPGGKLVFIDFHRPHWAHPLKGVMSRVLDTLEPFAKDLWHDEISHFGRNSTKYVRSKQTYFGGLFQKVVARRTGLVPHG